MTASLVPVSLPSWAAEALNSFLAAKVTGSFTLEVKEGLVLKTHLTEYHGPPVDKQESSVVR